MMNRSRKIRSYSGLALATLACCVGCESSRQQVLPSDPLAQRPAFQSEETESDAGQPPIHFVSHRQPVSEHDETVLPATTDEDVTENDSLPSTDESLLDLESLAIANNPTLRRMQHEASAAWAKTGYATKLPDPTMSAMFYTPPMNFQPDRQLAEVQVMQMIPWIDRLKAEKQRTHLEALVAQTQYQAELLRVIGDVRATWFKLYVLQKQIETTKADQEQLESLIKTANARVQTGDAQPGDVLMATLELSSLQEQLLGYRQQLASTSAELNRLAGRDVLTPVDPPTQVDIQLPAWDLEGLRQIAMANQPELNTARLRAAATRWGIRVARLKQRPDLTFGVGWVVMDAPDSVMADDGRDSLTLSVSGNLPVGRRKYQAMVSEASQEYYAAHASEDELSLQLDALLVDLWEQTIANQQTVELYEKSILPQARQTFEADQKALVNNSVAFDRVVRAYRTLLNLELGYHKALGQLATTITRIRQAAGVDLAGTAKLPSGSSE